LELPDYHEKRLFYIAILLVDDRGFAEAILKLGRKRPRLFNHLTARVKFPRDEGGGSFGSFSTCSPKVTTIFVIIVPSIPTASQNFYHSSNPYSLSNFL
jgi:hypothetical protein